MSNTNHKSISFSKTPSLSRHTHEASFAASLLKTLISHNVLYSFFKKVEEEKTTIHKLDPEIVNGTLISKLLNGEDIPEIQFHRFKNAFLAKSKNLVDSAYSRSADSRMHFAQVIYTLKNRAMKSGITYHSLNEDELRVIKSPQHYLAYSLSEELLTSPCKDLDDFKMAYQCVLQREVTNPLERIKQTLMYVSEDGSVFFAHRTKKSVDFFKTEAPGFVLVNFNPEGELTSVRLLEDHMLIQMHPYFAAGHGVNIAS